VGASSTFPLASRVQIIETFDATIVRRSIDTVLVTYWLTLETFNIRSQKNLPWVPSGKAPIAKNAGYASYISGKGPSI
jgi:hypothetical protein